VVPNFDVTRLSQLPWFILLAVAAGLMGAIFLRLLRWSEEAFQRLRAPIYARLAVGGLLVGLIAIEYPGVWGNGYIITNRILHDQFATGQIPILFVSGLFFAKLLATAAAVGSGTVGGVFTPTLFLGAGLGSAFGMALHNMGQAEGVTTAAFALVGMGGMLSATTHSPLLAMIMIFEISLNYSLMPPLMLACTVAVLLSRRLHQASIYTEPLRLKGLALSRESAQPETAMERTVGDLMRAPVTPVRETAKLGEIAGRFLESTNNFLPVVNASQQLIGVVALQDLKEYLTEGSDVGVIAYDVMRTPPACVMPSQSLLDILDVVLESEQRNIPVVNSFSENRLVGSLPRGEVLGIFSEAIAAGGEEREPNRFV
jgi:CIC family chloride channel protein